MIAVGLLPALGVLAVPVGLLVLAVWVGTRRPRGTGPACVRCGCTYYRACPGGCSWASLDPPICSRCV